jgi:hypothetical protein
MPDSGSFWLVVVIFGVLFVFSGLFWHFGDIFEAII